MAASIASVVRRRGVRQFVKFSIVGCSGLVVNFVIAHALQTTTALSGFADFAIGFIGGGVSNYVLNRIWTFRSQRNPLIEGLQFLAVSGIALLLGKAIFALAAREGYHHFTMTWLAATLAGTGVNFVLNKYWTFKHIS
jgi:putative flippase GtrA